MGQQVVPAYQVIVEELKACFLCFKLLSKHSKHFAIRNKKEDMPRIVGICTKCFKKVKPLNDSKGGSTEGVG